MALAKRGFAAGQSQQEAIFRHQFRGQTPLVMTQLQIQGKIALFQVIDTFDNQLKALLAQ